MQDKKQQLESDMEQQTGSNLGKEYIKQEEKGTTEDEMVGWHHRLNGCEFKQTPGDSE